MRAKRRISRNRPNGAKRRLTVAIGWSSQRKRWRLRVVRLEHQVEDQPDEHRDEDAEEQREREELLELVRGPDVGVLDDRGHREADGPAEEPGDERPTPAAVDAEQPAAHPPDDDDERDAVEEQRPPRELDRHAYGHPGILRRSERVDSGTRAATVSRRDCHRHRHQRGPVDGHAGAGVVPRRGARVPRGEHHAEAGAQPLGDHVPHVLGGRGGGVRSAVARGRRRATRRA